MDELIYSELSPQEKKNLIFLPPYKKGPVGIVPPLPKKEIIDWGLRFTMIPKNWAITKGEDIKIAVLDTGIDDHPDLPDSMFIGKTSYGKMSTAKDHNGHGTHIAGIIGARANDFGVIGVAPKCKLFIAKVISNSGFGFIEWATEAIYKAIELNVDIISMSFGQTSDNKDFHTAIQTANNKGIFLICSSGIGRGLHYPASYPETISVGAIDRCLSTRSTNVNYTLDILAPGYNMYSTYRNQSYEYMSGTSMATPFIAGVTALILAKHRNFPSRTPVTNNTELGEHLRSLSFDLGVDGDGIVGDRLPNGGYLLSRLILDFLYNLDGTELTAKGKMNVNKFLKKLNY